MQNFLSLDNLQENEILQLITEALDYKNEKRSLPDLSKHSVATFFLENSTRTRTSFEVAIKKTGAEFYSIDVATSAIHKGESLQDTLDTLGSLNINAVVIRSSEEFYYEPIDTSLIKIVNGGDGAHEHPSQALLDLVTIYEEFNDFAGLNVLIMGDIKHSRVAKSNVKVMKRLGMNVNVFSPEIFKHEDNDFEYIYDIDQEIGNYDVVMLLRNQLERHDEDTLKLHQTYLADYGLSVDRYNKLKQGAIVMHPGPFNRDVEISSEILQFENIRINRQVTNGIYARIAILNYVLNN